MTTCQGRQMLRAGFNFSLPATSHILALLDYRSWSQLRNDFNSKIFQIYSNILLLLQFAVLLYSAAFSQMSITAHTPYFRHCWSIL